MSLRISHDAAVFDFHRIVPFIQQSYWGAGRAADDIRRAISNSCVVGLFDGPEQIGMARAISDKVFHAYIYGLFVFAPHRGQGHARRLLDALIAHPDLAGVTGWMLSTLDAHGLYRKYGFQPVDAGRTMWMRRS